MPEGVGNRMGAEERLCTDCWRRNGCGSDGSKMGEGRGGSVVFYVFYAPLFNPGAVPTQVELAPQNADAKLKYRE